MPNVVYLWLQQGYIFPKLNDSLHLISFADIAVKYLAEKGYKPYICQDEDEARSLAKTLPKKKQWPCLYTKSDTTGEKILKSFYRERISGYE